jgi:hypothetical protein
VTDQDQERAGIDRRSLIKRSVIAGGAAVWATPVVQSFTSPAGAQTVGSPQCPSCYVFVGSVGGQTFGNIIRLTDPTEHQAVCDCILAGGVEFQCVIDHTSPATREIISCGGPSQPPCECV